MWRLSIEATNEENEGGPMPNYALERAPTWALQEALRAIQKELDGRSRIVFLMREEERRRARDRRPEGS